MECLESRDGSVDCLLRIIKREGKERGRVAVGGI